MELWRPVPNDSRYEVSDLGRVRRLYKTRGPRILSPAPNDDGYLKLSLGRARQEYVHRLVAQAFHGTPNDPDMTVDHVDFDKRHNHARNLRWLTLAQNAARHEAWELDQMWHGRRRAA